jgi:HAD superfamily hydrolase (TIGR01509 family)
MDATYKNECGVYFMAKIRAVIFDMDGLMLDTETIAVKAWPYAAGLFGYELSPEMLIETIGLNRENSLKIFRKYFDEGFADIFIEIESAAVKYVSDYTKENGVPIKKGLIELLDYLDRNSIKKGIATSSNKKDVLELIDRANLSDCFDIIICGDMIKNGKPEPDIFLAVAEGLGIEAVDCMVLEDSPNGILGAYRAGMKPVMIPDLKKPDDITKQYIFAQCDSLLDVIELL